MLLCIEDAKFCEVLRQAGFSFVAPLSLQCVELQLLRRLALLGSAVTNLLNNAFKYTKPGGRVVLSAQQDHGSVLIAVQDECGGFPERKGNEFRAFADRRGRDRTGLGLGLSIARRAVRAHGGDIQIRNLPGNGCIFIIEVPQAADDLPVPRAVVQQIACHDVARRAQSTALESVDQAPQKPRDRHID